MRRPFLRPLLTLLAMLAAAPALALQPDLARLDALPLHVAPPAAVAKAIAEAPAEKGTGPLLFAVTVPLAIDLDDGVWEPVDGATLRWRTRVYSQSARAVLLAFERFRLPPGAKLWFYDVEGRVVQGPYDGAAEGGLWTAMVPGDTAVLELRVASAQRGAVDLALGRLGHAFKNASDLGASGECNIDVACPLGNDWGNEIRATVKLQIPFGVGFVGLCSGTLVNNTAQNDRPFVLTADHCGIGEAGSPASGVVTYFNFQNSVCGVDAATDNQTLSGATLRADDAGTDMTLIELSAVPPAAFNVHYAGWDASGTGGNRGVSIHHPGGDAKKISEYTLPLTTASVQIEAGGPSIPAWRVARWEQGTTEQGSSGSGLWNESHRLVGTLSGGSAACNGSVDNDQPDFYARLDEQWTAGSAASDQLQAWLDPVGGGCLVLGGKNRGSASPVDCGGSTVGGGGGGTGGAAGGSGGGGGGGGGGGALGSGLGVLLVLAAARRRLRALCVGAALACAAPALSAAPALDALDALPLHAASQAKVAAALEQARAEPAQRPLRHAVAAPLTLGLSDGVWSEADTQAIWRTRIFSAGALSLSLRFDVFALPPGAELRLTDPRGELVQGPYTAADHTPEGMLWTAPVLGDTAVVELRVPAAARDAVRLRLGRVHHGFLDLSAGKAAKAGESGSCNINVACPLGDAWRDAIRSVATISIDGTRLCTGQLVNTVRGDETPLFLTADHCSIGHDPGDRSPSSVVFIWNYQTAGCNDSNGRLDQTQSGAHFVADDVGSDFTLLRLNQRPPLAYGVHYAGWDARSQAPLSGVGIHHPSGDLKKISGYDTAAVADVIDLGDGPVQAWRVRWSQGTTEPGSSGSGLWNQQGNVVGVLTGGDASCGNPGGDDYYGRLDVAWTANAAASGQLKAHLDPDNSGTRTLAGRDATLGPDPAADDDADDSEDAGGAATPALLLALLLLGALRRRR